MTLRERRRPGEFILSEADGFRSRSAVPVAADQVLDAGTVLQSGDDGAIPFDAGTCVGILVGAADTRLGSVRAAVLSGEAEVIFEELVYPIDKPATTWAALKALGIIGRGLVPADTGGGGGGETVADIILQNSSDTLLSRPEVGAVTTVVDIEFNDNLEEIALHWLANAGGDFTILHNVALTSQDLTSLVTVGGHLNLQDNYVLPSVSLPALTTIVGEFAIQGQNAMTTLLLSSLQTCVNFNVFDCPLLTELELPALTSVGPDGTGAALSIHSNAVMTSFSAPLLTSFATANIYENTLMQTFDLSGLVTIEDLLVHDNPAIMSLDFPALTDITDFFAFHDNPAASSIAFPVIQNIAGDFESTGGTDALRSITLGASLLTITGNVVFASCALTEASVDGVLVRLAALDGTAGTTSFDGKTVTLTGTSSPPSAVGLAAKVTLEGRGNTVTVNS
jgi:hypothetical protein